MAVTVFGGVLRFWRLDRPHLLVFDETYYVKQGWSMFKAGYELKWAGEGKVVDPKWNAGDVNVFTGDPDFVVHPPVGKWMIGAGEWIFGPTSSWGWRFSAALVGTVSILMLALIARRLFDSTLLGVIAGLLLAVDGEHFVHSRT
ncbi:MAG TPA: phospholipid carrier-dependent glycosyltransferase, partial [Kineosporiaceae bacterium]|nr:phospholipid carrier-dependent glycosyltransferase [Kineosporiaceae bacterium]